MLGFLIFYLAVYGGVHGYLYWRLAQAYQPRRLGLLLLGAFFVFAVAAPILARMLEHSGLVWTARLTALAGYFWMALAFWLLVLFLVRDLWNLLAGLAALIAPAAGKLSLRGPGSATVFLLLVVITGLYGLWEASRPRLERIEVRTRRIQSGSPAIRIAYISDVHLGVLAGEGKIRKILDLVRSGKPDLLIAGGDLVDGATCRFNHLADLFSAYNPPLGKYAVLGNHEYYAGLPGSMDFIAACGFRLLRGEAATVDDRLMLIGVDDPATRELGLARSSPPEEALLPFGDIKLPIILIKHRPEVAEESTGKFDLQLSGHTHLGQIFPFKYLVTLQYPLYDGFYDLGKGSSLYTSRGTGTWGPPMRVLAPPEITFITLLPIE